MMTLSLIIPAFDEEHYIGATLESVKRATTHAFGEQSQLDILVVDNASTDATAEIARSYGARVTNLQVTPSPRRFDRWSAWQILIWTNPIFIGLFRRRKAFWRGWYEQPVR